MNRKNKAGFTLVELMVVAIIVAILAAVAIPLMTGNKKKAMATEAQAGLGTLRTAMQVYKAENGGFPGSGSGKPYNTSGLNVKKGDLAGKYWMDDDYTYTSTSSNYTLTATGSTSNELLGLTVTLKEDGTWGGTLLP